MRGGAVSARFVAGLDGGGTKTTLCCLDGAGQVVYEGSFGPMNINSPDRGAVLAALAAIARQILSLEAMGRACAGLVVAAAGTSHPDARDFIGEGLKQGGYRGPFTLQGDHEAALRGAVGPEGAILIAGTGAICYGRRADGHTARAGGWGYLLGDEGGGYALGREMLGAILRAEDGRGQPTRLKELVFEARGLRDPGDIIRFAYDQEQGKAKVAGLAELLPRALKMGDGTAKDIARKAADDLFSLCEAVLARLALQEGRLALMGGVLGNITCIREGLKARLAEGLPALQVLSPKHSAAWGAADLARELYLG